MVTQVELAADAYLSCLTHALSTEREEVMGLLLGEVKDGGKVVSVCTVYMMRRSDKRPDRVEISPEQLSAAAIEAEALANRLQRRIQVLGWYHSHPHITVWPSHVDVRTQADYQMMDPNFIGLIFSCFSEADKKYNTKLVCFQSVNKHTPREPPQYIHVEIPLFIIPTLHNMVSPMCASAITHLLEILFEEEKESYYSSISNCKDDLTAIQNGAVYTQSLAHTLQVLGAPVMQLLHHEVERNKTLIHTLTAQKEELLAKLEQRRSV